MPSGEVENFSPAATIASNCSENAAYRQERYERVAKLMGGHVSLVLTAAVDLQSPGAGSAGYAARALVPRQKTVSTTSDDTCRVKNKQRPP
jgi:hypothetical protein